MSYSEDVSPGVDFLSEEAAKKWAHEAEGKLVSRIAFFDAFVQALTTPDRISCRATKV
jgi:hypothetical protein